MSNSYCESASGQTDGTDFVSSTLMQEGFMNELKIIHNRCINRHHKVIGLACDIMLQGIPHNIVIFLQMSAEL